MTVAWTRVVNRGGGKKWSDSGYGVKMKPAVYANWLIMKYK